MATEGTRSGSTSIGAAIAGYRIARLLGGGRFGRVFECYTPDDRKIAIKLLRTKFNALGDPLLKNVRALQQVESAHVVKVIDVAIYGGSTYIAMEYVDGDGLSVRLKSGPLRSVEALERARQAAIGLQAVWAHGIAHGDVRPANLLVSGDALKVVDALLAPPIEGFETLCGSPEYLAPERQLGTPPDALSDIYALGCTLYELLSGQPPFEGDAASVMSAHTHQEPRPLSTSPSVADLVMRMMAKDRAQRLKTWTEVIDGVGRALAGSAQAVAKKPELGAVDISFDEMSGEHDDGLFDDLRTARIPAFDSASPSALRDDGPAPARPPHDAARSPSAAPQPVAARVSLSQPARAPAQPPAPISRPQPPAPSGPAVLPVVPLARAGDDDEGHTVVRPMTPGPVPSAEDIGLTLDPVDE